MSSADDAPKPSSAEIVEALATLSQLSEARREMADRLAELIDQASKVQASSSHPIWEAISAVMAKLEELNDAITSGQRLIAAQG